MGMDGNWNRRQFLHGAAGSAGGLAVAGTGAGALGAVERVAGLRGRFLTHVSVVRVNQIEVTPERSIGEDEAADNRPERIRSRREAFARGCPGGRMTWAISWLALNDSRQEYKEARRLLASYHDRYGDEITFIPGGYFAPMYDTRQHIRETIHKALGSISEMVGGRTGRRSWWQAIWTRRTRGFWPPRRTFMWSRARSGASTASTTAMGTGASAIRITPAGSTT